MGGEPACDDPHRAFGGQTAGDLYEYGSDRHFPMRVRLAREYRSSLETIRNITIGAPNPNGGVVQVPLSEIAAAVGTPVYVYSSATLLRHLQLFEEALAAG